MIAFSHFVNKTGTSLTPYEILWEADLINGDIKIHNAEALLDEADALVTHDINSFLAAVVHPEDLPRVSYRVEEFLSNEKNGLKDEDRFRIYNNKTGNYIWIYSRLIAERNETGNTVYVKGSFVNVAESTKSNCELLKQLQQHQFLLENIAPVIFTIDTACNFTTLTDAWYNVSGYTLPETIGKTVSDFLSDDHKDSFSNAFADLLSTPSYRLDEKFLLEMKSGEKVWVRIKAKASTDCNNIVTGIIGTIENINASYREELLLQESNEKINSILNNSREIIITINLEENTISNVNDAVSILGYSSAEWVGKSCNAWNNLHKQKFHELMRLAITSHLQVQNKQIWFPNKSNTESIPFEFSTSIFQLKNSRYLLCVLRDIRERLKYEEDITRISNQLKHLLNNIDDVYAIYDLKNSRYDFISDNIEGLYGCDKHLFCTNHYLWRDCIVEEDVAEVEKEVADIISNKTRGEIFYRITSKTGERRMLLDKLVVGKDTEGNADKLYIVKKDYTNIENAERSLMESERKFRFISENITDFISIHDANGTFTYASPSIKNILGFVPSEIVGLGGFDLIHPDDFVRVMAQAAKLILTEKKETQLRSRMLSKTGNYKWIETSAKPVIDSRGGLTSVICSSRDVTYQVDAENKLKESEERYRLLSENSNDLVGIHKLNKEWIYVSPSCVHILGYQPEELIGKNPEDVLINKDDDSHISKADEVVREKKGYKYLRRIITKQGEEKLLEIWLQPVFKDGKIVALQSSSRDVTEREKLLHSLEQSLAKERELNELRAKFVSTASHQFRTPLTVIQSGVEIMDMYVDDLPKEKQAKFQKQFKKIQEEVDRLEHLMNDVLVLGRANAARTPFNPKVACLVKFCRDIIDNKYNHRYAPERQVLLQITGVEVPVSFDRTLMAHSIENILNNAYKYSTGENVLLHISFEQEKVRIDISDKGIGIPAKDIKDLFLPFSRATNTTEIEGTGLGLSIVKEFIDKHGGEIFISSKLNKGTTISVILPID